MFGKSPGDLVKMQPDSVGVVWVGPATLLLTCSPPLLVPMLPVLRVQWKREGLANVPKVRAGKSQGWDLNSDPHAVQPLMLVSEMDGDDFFSSLVGSGLVPSVLCLAQQPMLSIIISALS